MSISVSIEERDALCEVVEAQNGSLQAIGTPLAKHQWEKAESAFRHHLQDCRFLECLRLEAPDKHGQINVGMREHELRETLSRLVARRMAQLVVEESESTGTRTPEQEAFQERARVALRACERALMGLATRYEIRFVVVSIETEGAAAQPTTNQDFAFDLCEALNEDCRPRETSRSCP